MDVFLQGLRIVAESWPLAAMVVGVAAAVVVRRSLRQAMDNTRAESEDRAQGNRAVVVSGREE